jgi:hypothetical protein
MVKLVFKPSDQCTLESKSSKRKEINLNPFAFHEPSCKQSTNEINETICVKDLVGLEHCSYILHEWFSKKPEKALVIIGPVGCGKSTLIHLYCKENSIHMYKIPENLKTKKDLVRELLSFVEYSSADFFTKGGTKKCIFIDEYQNSNTDLVSVTDINNMIHEKELGVTLPHVVIVSVDSKGSKLSELKKINEVYYIPEIPFATLKTWAKKIYQGETNIDTVIKKCKSDKRLLLNTLEFMKLNKNCTSCTNCIAFMDSFYKDISVNMFECIHSLFDAASDIDIYKVYNTDGFAISNLVYENYIDYGKDIHRVAYAADSISLGETIYSDTYDSIKSFIPYSHCVNALCVPSYYLKNDVPNKNVRVCSLNNRYNTYLNNKKIINKINENAAIPYDITDILYLKKFLNNDLTKIKVLKPHQEDFLRNIKDSMNIERMELIYKHFSEFNSKETKVKNFTLKFREKLKNLL